MSRQGQACHFNNTAREVFTKKTTSSKTREEVRALALGKCILILGRRKNKYKLRVGLAYVRKSEEANRSTHSEKGRAREEGQNGCFKKKARLDESNNLIK